MPKYTVKSPIQHDGERFEIGEPFECSIKTAEPLLAVGALGEPETSEPAPADPLLALLDKPIREIVAAIQDHDPATGAPTISDADLTALLEAETNGKTRKGLMAAIVEEQRDRSVPEPAPQPAPAPDAPQ